MQLRLVAQWLLILPTVSSSSIADRDLRQIRKRDVAKSDPYYPSPWMNPEADGWAEAYIQAKDFVSQLTLAEKVNLTTGVG